MAVLESEGSRFYSRFLLAKFQSVLEQDTEPQLTALDKQVGVLVSTATGATHLGVCEVHCNVKRFREKRYINAFHYMCALTWECRTHCISSNTRDHRCRRGVI